MSKQFRGAENLAILSLYIFYVSFMSVFMINELHSGLAKNWLEITIAGVAITVLTILYVKSIKPTLDEKREYSIEPKKLDTFLLVILVVSLFIEAILFILYVVMFITNWNRVLPYSYKWTEITMFCVTFLSLTLGVTAFIKNISLQKNVKQR